jgi:hypothetical protein
MERPRVISSAYSSSPPRLRWAAASWSGSARRGSWLTNSQKRERHFELVEKSRVLSLNNSFQRQHARFLDKLEMTFSLPVTTNGQRNFALPW